MQLDPTDFNDIRNNHGYPYILLVGLLFHDSQYLINGTFNLHVESIIDGSLDDQIVTLANRIKNVGAPVFLRPGFEFGVNNSGFHNDEDLDATAFKNIWLHIYNIFSEQQVTNVAWVWNTVNPSNFNYMEWYPGDEYVDWFGINFFTYGQINGSDGFVNSAKVHNKPVMICESSPILSDGTLNTSNWQNWFAPYFSKIKSEKQIKAFVYINSPWTMGPFSDWPESRIVLNATISENYKTELQDSIFIHMNEYLQNPDILSSINETEYPKFPKRSDFEIRNYPNPFNSITVFRWESTTTEKFHVSIFNVLGIRVDSFDVNKTKIGLNEIAWNAQSLNSGIYYVKINSANSHNRQVGLTKVVFIK